MRVSALALVAVAAVAEAAPPSNASREFVVEGSGGGYEVTVSSRYVTVFYLPEPVTKALASDQRNFSITVMNDTVAVRPLRDAKDLSANLNIDTKSLHISVLLKVGVPADATLQVIFTRA